MNSKEKAYDYIVKLLIIGDGNVGKTNMLLRICENKFIKSHLTTIGMDFKTKNLELDGKKVHLQIWDTAGQDRFKTITKNYYKGAHGIMMAYAINDRNSFNNIDNWMKQIKDHASEAVAIVLVGTKCDVEERAVTFLEGKKLADLYGVPFIETSAKNDINVEEAFEIIARAAREKVVIKNETIIDDDSNASVSLMKSKLKGYNAVEDNSDESKCSC